MSDLAEPRAAATARVFFALWPDEPVRRQLIQHGEKMHRLLGGKLAQVESVHMTLLFLGDVPVQQLEVLRALGGAAAFEPFTLRLDQTGCWKHNKVAWVAPTQIPPALARVVQTLEEGLDSAGFRFDRRPLSPHITLLRKARCVPLLDKVPAIEWAVGEFVLVRSELHSEGSRYAVVGRWPSAPEAQP